MAGVKYTPAQSFVESAFFTKLSELKLNQYKLDSSKKPITAFGTHPLRLTKFNDAPVINLDIDSFATDRASADGNILHHGYIHNVNTIEEFKSTDKHALLTAWGHDVWQRVQRGQGFGDFYMLAFLDLKKYKFYYWVAYPALNTNWETVSRRDTAEYDAAIVAAINDNYAQFYQLNDGKLVQLDRWGDLNTFVFVDSHLGAHPSVELKNYLYYLAFKGYQDVTVVVFQNDGTSYALELALKEFAGGEVVPKISGWERTSNGKLGPKLADLGALIDPHQLAEQAVDLNLKLMKWRIAPELDLDTIKSQRVLLLGAGTLGSYVARALMGWGIKDITFVDNGRVSYSNPVRQPLFTFADCFSDGGHGAFKAETAAASLHQIFPGVKATGITMEVPMVGHGVGSDSDGARAAYDKLNQLFDAHDAVFLLMDSRESRWLPTLLGYAKGKTVINAALGFDSYLVMRHGTDTSDLGCYYCNDVVAPDDSLTDRTLDQMCTVTRPGGALMAASLAVELLVSILQHQDHDGALADAHTVFGDVPHQIRGYLHSFTQTKLTAPRYSHCSACSAAVLEGYRLHGWDFVQKCLADAKYLEEFCGLKQVQADADKAAAELMEEYDDDDWMT